MRAVHVCVCIYGFEYFNFGLIKDVCGKLGYDC